MSEMVDEFIGYVRDIGEQPLTAADRDDKLRAVLGRLADAAVRKASSSLVPADLDLSSIPDAELADRMQMHVQARSGGLEVVVNTRLPNSAWVMMLEAARRLRNVRAEA